MDLKINFMIITKNIQLIRTTGFLQNQSALDSRVYSDSVRVKNNPDQIEKGVFLLRVLNELTSSISYTTIYCIWQND